MRSGAQSGRTMDENKNPNLCEGDHPLFPTEYGEIRDIGSFHKLQKLTTTLAPAPRVLSEYKARQEEEIIIAGTLISIRDTPFVFLFSFQFRSLFLFIAKSIVNHNRKSLTYPLTHPFELFPHITF